MPEQASNHKAIERWIVGKAGEGDRVLDIGCGDGELLGLLLEERNIRGTGIELSEACVMKAIQRGISVHHGNVEEGLDHYSDGNFDLVILSLTIQELNNPQRVLQEAFRVGKRAIVVFPNFGYWNSRWQLGILGRAPRVSSLPHTWYDSPNRHFLTIADWEEFCAMENLKVIDRCYLAQGKPVVWLSNLRAEIAMYLLEKRNDSPQNASTDPRKE